MGNAALILLVALPACVPMGGAKRPSNAESVPGELLDFGTLSPGVVIDLNGPDTSRRVHIVGALRLQGGRIAAADGESDRLTYYNHAGNVDTTIQLGLETPFRERIHQLLRVNGDTVALVTGFSRALLFDGKARVIGRVNSDSTMGRLPNGVRVLLGFAAGRTLIASMIQRTAPAPGQSRWVDSMTIDILRHDGRRERALGPFPAVIGAAKNGRRQQVWFAPHAVYAFGDSMLFYGFGDEYRINKFSAGGTPAGQITRPWQRVAVTDADILAYIEGWGSRWITSTGEAAEAEKREMRSDPFFEYVPAFSQFLANIVGELWVRSPELVDARGNGELNTVPFVPSSWSIFDSSGRWRGVVKIPERILPMELGPDYLVAIDYGIGKARKLIVYDLPAALLARLRS